MIVAVASVLLSWATSEAEDKLVVEAHPSELSLFAAENAELAKLAPALRLAVQANATYVGSGRAGRALLAFDRSIAAQEVLKRLAEVDASDIEPVPRGVAEKLRDAAPRIVLESARIAKLDELIVISDAARQSNVSSVAGLPIESRSAAGNFITIKKENGFNAEDILAVAREPSTKYVEPNYALELFGAQEPNDPRFSSGRQWGLTNVAFPKAWEAGAQTSTAIVAVIDTGMFYIHPDLSANIWINSGEVKDNLDNDGNGHVDDLNGVDFRDMDGNPIAGPGGETHATQIAGVIGAVGNNGQGMTGAAWTIKIMPLRVFVGRYGDLVAAIKAIDYAIANEANIINLSWGMKLGDEAVTLRQAMDRAEAAGVLIVAAAGNSGVDIDKSVRVFPASYTNRNVIAVAALSSKEELAKGENWASNYGATSVDLAAPGEGILSLFPGIGASAYDDTDDVNDDGTSLAAPYVTGAAALIWTQMKMADKGLSNTKIMERTRDLLLRNTRALVALNGKTVTGGALDLGFMAAPTAIAARATRSEASASSSLETITGRLAIPSPDLGAAGTGALIEAESGPVQLDIGNDKPLTDFLRALNGEEVTINGVIREEIQAPHGKVRILTPNMNFE